MKAKTLASTLAVFFIIASISEVASTSTKPITSQKNTVIKMGAGYKAGSQ